MRSPNQGAHGLGISPGWMIAMMYFMTQPAAETNAIFGTMALIQHRVCGLAMAGQVQPDALLVLAHA